MSISSCDDGLFSGSASNDDDKRKQPDFEPPVPEAFTPATMSLREIKHRKECESCFKLLLRQPGGSKATALLVGDLGEMLKALGMSLEVTEDELCEELKKAGYADENGCLDFGQFITFARDFELLESLLVYNASRLKGGEYFDRGPLGAFFKTLAEKHRETKHRKEIETCFEQLLDGSEDPEAAALPAGALCNLLIKLGMAPDVTEDELCDFLKKLEHAEENGTMDIERFTRFAEKFQLVKSLREYNFSQWKGVEYVERGPLRDIFKALKANELDLGFSGSSSNDNERRKQPVFNPPELEASTSAIPSYREIMHVKESRSCFKRLLSHRGGPEATLTAGALCNILKKLGMAPDVTEDELCAMLKLSKHADEYGTMDFNRFTIFAKDFMLLESLRAYKASRLKDQGPLGAFFTALQLGEELSGFTSGDFDDVFFELDIELTEESADSLARYANLHPGVNITFEQFLKVLRKQHEEYMQRTGQTISSRRKVTLDKGHRLGRLMSFVSSYLRSDRALRKAVMLLNNDTEAE